MFFFANRDVAEGEELCFSYIDHKFLCEILVKRSALLGDMKVGFGLEGTDNDDINERPAKRQRVPKNEAIRYPIWNIETQKKLMAIPPAERLEHMNDLLVIQDYQCDKSVLRVLKAITLEGLGRSNAHRGDKKAGLEHALHEWEMAVEFSVKNFPPLDETIIALKVQAALCASVNAFGDFAKLALRTKGLRVGDRVKAKRYADEALEMHDLIFGGGKERFLRRFVDELFKFCLLIRKRSMPQTQFLSNLQDLWGFTQETWDKVSNP